MAGQMNWNLENGIDALWSKVRNKFGVLANKLPQSVLHSILRASPGLKIFMLVLLGFVLYGRPGVFVASQAYPWLYGFHYVVLFATVLVYGKLAAVGLHLALTLLNVIFAGTTLREIIGEGVPTYHFANNLTAANWPGLAYGILVAACFIVLFAFFTGWLNSKFSNKAFFVLLAAHFLALTVCIFGLTIIQTGRIHLPLASIVTIPSVFLAITGMLGVLLLKVLWNYGGSKSGGVNAQDSVASWVFCIVAFSVLAFAVPTNTLPSAVGGIIRFGGYDWLVLEVQNGEALILSEKVLERRAYHSSGGSVTWAGSELRAYLNGEFYNKFSAQDRARIVETSVTTNNNPWFGARGGDTTKDRIFLLSIEEVVKYFGDSGQLKNRPVNAFWIDDQYNNARIAEDAGGAASWWWLRSPGANDRSAAGVFGDGGLSVRGFTVNGGGGVRPALRLNLKS